MIFFVERLRDSSIKLNKDLYYGDIAQLLLLFFVVVEVLWFFLRLRDFFEIPWFFLWRGGVIFINTHYCHYCHYSNCCFRFERFRDFFFVWEVSWFFLIEWRRKMLDFLVERLRNFFHYCLYCHCLHYCHYSHYCHYCHYSNYCHIVM